MNKNLLPFFLFCLSGAFACGSTDQRLEQEEATADSSAIPAPASEITQDDFEQFTGLLFSSGLQPKEAEALGLGQNHYQLVSQQSYFFSGPDSLQQYLGQCMALRGTVQKAAGAEGEATGGQHTYGRGIVQMEAMQQQPGGYCFYTDSLQYSPQGREVSYLGQITHMQRPAPDIAYDYQIKLQKPYRDPNHPIEPGRLVSSLPLGTSDFNMLSLLEQAARQGKTLRIIGVQHQGYAESQAIWISRADSTAL